MRAGTICCYCINKCMYDKSCTCTSIGIRVIACEVGVFMVYNDPVMLTSEAGLAP